MRDVKVGDRIVYPVARGTFFDPKKDKTKKASEEGWLVATVQELPQGKRGFCRVQFDTYPDETPAKRRKEGLQLNLTAEEKKYVNLTCISELREKRLVSPIQLQPIKPECYIGTVRELPRALRDSAEATLHKCWNRENDEVCRTAIRDFLKGNNIYNVFLAWRSTQGSVHTAALLEEQLQGSNVILHYIGRDPGAERGSGRILFSAAAAFFAQRGNRAVWSASDMTMSHAEAFHELNGFSPVSTKTWERELGEKELCDEGSDVTYYRKPLTVPVGSHPQS